VDSNRHLRRAAIVAPVELIGNVAAGLIAAGLLVYLVFVLIRPERF
jgi:K+-transporting ATPase KdpF subunit